MTVAELLEQLKQYPPEHRVCVDGYEGGVADIGRISLLEVKLNVNSEWYYGDHEPIDGGYTRDKHGEPDAVVVYLPRTNA